MNTKLIIPNKIANKYRYLLKRFKKTEWSGPAWYRAKFDKDGFPEQFKIVHFHPLDLGHSTATEWEAKDLAKILKTTIEKHPSLKHCFMGLIHSHHTMGAFLSGTDQETVQENAPREGFYCSLVVASAGKATEAFGFGYKDQYNVSHCLTIEEDNIELQVPEAKIEPEWKEQADTIQKNKPKTAATGGQQQTMFQMGTYNQVSWQEKRQAQILNQFSKSKQKKIRKLVDKNSEGNLDDVTLEVKLEELGMQTHEILYFVDDSMTNYGYAYGGYNGW
jgi:hypothetical protein